MNAHACRSSKECYDLQYLHDAVASQSSRIAVLMRRWISTLLTALMLANLAAWPSFALADVLEHEVTAVQVSGQDQPVEPSPVHCNHGCVGHLSQHFQFQTGTVSIGPRQTVSDDISIEPDVVFPKHFPVLPFRPPLSAPILS